MSDYITTDFERGMDAGRQAADARLMVENANLKKQVQELEYDLVHMELSICPNCGARLRVLDLEDENEELRKLLRALLLFEFHPQSMCGTDACPIAGECSAKERKCRLRSWVAARAVDLGVEI